MIRLAVRVRREHAEIVLAELLELAPEGVEEVEVDARTIEYAVYGPPGELPALPDLRAAAGGALVEVSTRVLADDWRERWRRFHRPVLIEPPRSAARSDDAVGPLALRVRPPWEPPAPASAERLEEIVVEPGQAFGTGAHATTRLCLELLLGLAVAHAERGELLDVGTGSGVLAIAAARLGFAPVVAIDNDAKSVDATRANARANDVAIQAQRLDLRSERLPAGAEVVCANLLRPLLLELAAVLRWRPRALILGGLLLDDATEVAEAFQTRLGMRLSERRESGEWSALALER